MFKCVKVNACKINGELLEGYSVQLVAHKSEGTLYETEQEAKAAYAKQKLMNIINNIWDGDTDSNAVVDVLVNNAERASEYLKDIADGKTT